MCGIAGFLESAAGTRSVVEDVLQKMSRALVHRGPDDSGCWLDPDSGIALGHRRLAVLELSQAGHQPMVSASGRYALAFNGEIYNHGEMRDELQLKCGVTGWRGHSDTETLLAAIEQWGIGTAIAKSVGMFAFALWDRSGRTLTLARDRLGEKPLYFGWQQGVFLFASELKAMRAHPAFDAAIDRSVLAEYLRLGYVPAPFSIYQDIYKLPPGFTASIRARSKGGTPPAFAQYWSFANIADNGRKSPFSGSEEDAIAELEDRLGLAVALQSEADVPLGAFLSGGIDSSTIVALMQARTSRPIRTFTVGFHDQAFDEAAHAKAIAAHLGTEHAEIYVEPSQALDVIPRLPELFDEPFGDSSSIPTFLVSEFARRSVTVSISGDGGDELFAGYRRYARTAKAWNSVSWAPYALRLVASRAANAARFGGGPNLNWRAERLREYLAAPTAADFYAVQISQRVDGQSLVLGAGGSPESPIAWPEPGRPGDDLYSMMMRRDTTTYLPDDILVKVDRAAMGVSLETRVPLLDHRVVEFVWRLPRKMKVRAGEGKWLLRQVLAKYVPRELTDRPKAGFRVPIGNWLRGPLREWADGLLSPQRIGQDGYLDPQQVRTHWSRFFDDGIGGIDSIWPILMFQAWLSALK